MSKLVRLALEALQDSECPAGLKSVASATLLSAFEVGVDVPPGAHILVWRHLLASDAGAAALHRQELVHPDVASDAVRVLLDVDAGESAQELALAVLRNGNVSAITSDELYTIADRVVDEGRARRIGWLVEHVHEERGLAPEFVTALRDRLARSALPAVRSTAVEVGALLARLDEAFIVGMLADGSPVVRTAAADALEKVNELDRTQAIALIRAHLAVENHRSVVSACLYCLGSLLRSGGRRARMWEPPAGEGN